MPLYDYKCRECGHEEEHLKSVDDVTDECKDCGATSDRIFTAQYYVHSDIDFVTDNITGAPVRVDSRVKLGKLMREHGLTQKVGKGWV